MQMIRTPAASRRRPHPTRSRARRVSRAWLAALALVSPVAAVADTGAGACASHYDPLRVDADAPVLRLDREVIDDARARSLPIRLYLPGTPAGPQPVLLFSHGLGGSRENNAYLGQHWARRGYIVVVVQHPGSDAAPGQGRAALAEAASARSFIDRVRDVPVVLDQLAKWHAAPGDALAGRLDLAHVGMSGHSFGGVTAQAVSGQRFLGSARFTDPRIDAAVALSPSAPRRGSAAAAFGAVTLPWLRGDPAARAWLDDPAAVRAVLQDADRWRRK